MKVMFSFSIRCPAEDTSVTLYKRHSMPFCPPIGLEMYMDDCEHTVTNIFWSPSSQELSVTLDGLDFDSVEEVKKDVESFKSNGWFDDSNEHRMGD